MVNIIEEGQNALNKVSEMLPKNNNHNTNSSEGFFGKLLKSKDDESSLQQLAIGGASGWITGYTFTKFGKIVCLGVGISLVGAYLGHRSGYLKVDMKKVKSQAPTLKAEMERMAKKAEKELPGMIEKASRYAADNAFLVIGFSAGYLIGFGSA